MVTTLRTVAISFFIIIIRLFIQNMNRSETLYTTQQIDLADERLNIIKKKIATLKEQYFVTGVLSSLIID